MARIDCNYCLFTLWWRYCSSVLTLVKHASRRPFVSNRMKLSQFHLDILRHSKNQERFIRIKPNLSFGISYAHHKLNSRETNLARFDWKIQPLLPVASFGKLPNRIHPDTSAMEAVYEGQLLMSPGSELFWGGALWGKYRPISGKIDKVLMGPKKPRVLT